MLNAGVDVVALHHIHQFFVAHGQAQLVPLRPEGQAIDSLVPGLVAEVAHGLVVGLALLLGHEGLLGLLQRVVIIGQLNFFAGHFAHHRLIAVEKAVFAAHQVAAHNEEQHADGHQAHRYSLIFPESC